MSRARPVAIALLLTAVFPASGRAFSATSVRYVSVSVATLWTSPSAPRAIDAPALRNPANVRAWTRALSVAARRGLGGRIETQALLGEPVLVLRRQGSWSRVLVLDQPTPRDPRGYPGWVPSRQLASSATYGRLLAGRIAVVVSPTAWLSAARGRSRTELSFGTRLPATRVTATTVLVATPGGATATLPRSAVRVYRSARAIPRPTGQQIVSAARAFFKVRYLWGGTSAFGFDCSGLVNLIYRSFGRVIPRDADAQARGGRWVPRSALRPGDLVFYGRAHVHHVALYAGGGMMIEAPDSSSWVRLTPLRLGDWAGARRYA